MDSKKRNRLEYLDLAKNVNPDQREQKVITPYDKPIKLVKDRKNSNPENKSCCEKYTAQLGRSNIEMLKSFIFNFSSIQLVMEKSIEDFGEKLVNNIFSNTEEEMEANRQRQIKLEKEVEEFFRFKDSSPTRKRQKISDNSVPIITNTRNVTYKGKSLLKNSNNTSKEANPIGSSNVKTESVKNVTDHTFNDWKIPASVPLPAQAERKRPLKPPPALIPSPWLRRTSGLWLESVHEKRSALKDMAISPADSSTRGPPLKREEVGATSMTWDDDTSPSTSTGITEPPAPGFHWRTNGPTISWDESIGAPPPLSSENTKPQVNHPAEIWGEIKPTLPNLWSEPLELSTTTKPETASKATSTAFNDFLTSDLFDVFYSHPGTALVATRYALSRRIGRWGDALDLTTSIAEEDYPHIDTPDSPPPLEDIPTFVNLGPSTSDGRYITEYQFFRPHETVNSDDSD